MIYDKEGNKYVGKFIFDKIDYYINNKNNIKILNAGCGSNRIAKYKNNNQTIIGLDNNNPLAELNFDLNEKLDIKNEEFDSIICMHVIEHLYNPIKTFQEFNRILKKGGILYVSTPSPFSESAWDDPYHIRPYTINSLKILGKDSGFKSIYGFYTVKTPLFGLLKLNKFEKFCYYFSYKLNFLTKLSLLRNNCNIFYIKQ